MESTVDMEQLAGTGGPAEDARGDLPATPVAEVGAEQEVQSVSLGDILGGAQAHEAEQDGGYAATETAQEAAPAPTAYKTQEEVDVAYSKRLAAERGKWQPHITFAQSLLSATGESDPDKAKEMILGLLAEKRATERGTKPEIERETLALHQRLAAIEGGYAQSPPPAAQAATPDSGEWARRTIADITKAADAHGGDSAFYTEAMTQGSQVNRLIVSGFSPEEAWQMTRGNQAAKPKAAAAPPPQAAKAGGGKRGGVDISKLSEAEFAKIDEQLKRGMHVRLE